MEFTELDMHPDLRRAIEDAGYVTCTPVQADVFPHAFAGEDIFAQSQTGTGKTAAFLVSILQRIMTVPEQRTRKVLILAPTRELAVQIEGETRKLGKYLPISSGAFYGGVSYGPQVDMLRADVQMIIGTPGRIIDLVKQGKMLLKDVGFLVIDEADRMFDMGFIDDLRRLIRYLPPPASRQTFLFSATLGMRIKDLAWEYMENPREISIEPEHVTVELAVQELYHVGSHEKMRLLLGILRRENPGSALIFANQKYMVEELARRLKMNGVECEYIMGDLPQSKRLEIIDRLKAGELRVLVATDVAARGLDVQALDLVVNYDVPNEVESYVHRIGRTARAGKAGKAVTLACEKFVYGLPAIEKFIGFKIPVMAYDRELYLEDRSEGIRFHREHGRSDGRGRPGDRGGRPGERGRTGDRPYGRPGEGRPRPGPRPHAHGGRDRDDARVGPPSETWRDDRPEYRREDTRREDARRDAPPRDSRDNPYALPQDERLRQYKEKYGAKAGEPRDPSAQGGTPAGEGQPPRRDGRRGEGRRDDPARRDDRSRGGDGRGGRGGRGEGRAPGGASRDARGGDGRGTEGRGDARPRQDRGGERRPQPRPQTPQPTKPAAATGKPGLLDRLRGLFRGGKRSE